MKNFLTVLLLIGLSGVISVSYGQWSKHTIDTYIYRPAVVKVGDIDNDDDLDVVATGCYAGGDVFWYENDNLSWTEHLIDPSLDNAVGVHIADIDGDSTLDVVAAGYVADVVVWYKNSNAGQTWTEYTIDADLDGAEVVYAADLDGDGDQDVIATGANANKVVLYWNGGGTPVTWTPHFIDENLDGAMCLDTADIDRDNDPDIIATGSNANVVVWYENPTWSKDTIDANLLGAWGVRAADMDGDDNPDVVAAGTNANSVVWYKNNDAGQTWEKDTIDANLLGPFCLYIGDIDLDKSLDVVVTDRYGNKVVWYPNNLPAPWVRDTIDYNLAWANDVVLADIDDDTDLDAVVTAWNANQVVWYENQFIVGIKRLQEIVPAGWSLSQNYPNPFNPSTVISWQLSVSSSVTLTIFTITGKKVVTLVDKRQPAGFYSIEWDASNLASGVYLYRLQTGDYVETRKMVLMR